MREKSTLRNIMHKQSLAYLFICLWRRWQLPEPMNLIPDLKRIYRQLQKLSWTAMTLTISNNPLHWLTIKPYCRFRISISSCIFSFLWSGFSKDAWTQFERWVSMILDSTAIKAFLTAFVWLRISTQYSPDSIILMTPFSWPSILFKDAILFLWHGLFICVV